MQITIKNIFAVVRFIWTSLHCSVVSPLQDNAITDTPITSVAQAESTHFQFDCVRLHIMIRIGNLTGTNSSVFMYLFLQSRPEIKFSNPADELEWTTEWLTCNIQCATHRSVFVCQFWDALQVRSRPCWRLLLWRCSYPPPLPRVPSPQWHFVWQCPLATASSLVRSSLGIRGYDLQHPGCPGPSKRHEVLKIASQTCKMQSWNCPCVQLKSQSRVLKWVWSRVRACGVR